MGVGPILKMRYSIILLALLCVACGNYSANVPTIKPYKMDIQQGNVVTPKMMMQLRPGMTKSQVRFIMGTPLLVDSFHADRWDYFYQMRKDGKILEQRRVILDFEGDSLAHVRGDVIPAGSDPAAVGADQTKSAQPRPVVKPAAKEKGLLDKLKFWGDDEDGKKDVPKEPVKPAEPVKQEIKPAPKPEPKPEPKAEPAPEPIPQPAAAKEDAPKPAAQEEKKGWLDKLKFWGDDEKTPVKAAPAPIAKPVEPTKPAPVKIEQPKAEPVKAEPVKAEPVKTEPATPEAAKVEAKPPEPVAEPAPAPRRPSLPEAKPKAPPQPAATLPPEDSPDFFEKMLEKIGF